MWADFEQENGVKKGDAGTMSGQWWDGDGEFFWEQQKEQKWERAITVSRLKMILLPLILIRVLILRCERQE